MGEILIVTGMSGAGKTVCLKHLEDFGFNCIDNLPIGLMNSFLELLLSSRENEQRTALGIDSRNGKELSELEKIIENWREEKKVPFRILFLDAGDEVLIQRYSGRNCKGKRKDGLSSEKGGFDYRYLQTFNEKSSAAVKGDCAGGEKVSKSSAVHSFFRL